MEQLQLQRGDVFCKGGLDPFQRAVNFIQRINSPDDEAEYGHSGIILNSDGASLEVLWRVCGQNIFEAYRGKKILIARPLVPQRRKNDALAVVLIKYVGQRYPVRRLFLHLVPPLAKYIHGESLVCSELVAKYLHLAGARHGSVFGTTPDNLADEFKHWREYKVIYEGIL